MHELSLAEQLLIPVLETAAAHDAKVTVVQVEAGALQQIVPRSLITAFQAVSEGTPAEGAELRVETVPVTAKCRRCRLEFEVEDFLFACPDCGIADVETSGGTELILTSLELER